MTGRPSILYGDPLLPQALQREDDALSRGGDILPPVGGPIETPYQLATIGRMIFGEPWRREMAKALGVNLRSVERWVSGAYTIPDDLHHSLAEAALKKADMLEKLAKHFYGEG